jgi:hypothetical protein
MPFYPREKSPRYPFDRRLGDLQACVDAVAKRKIPFPVRAENRIPVVQPVV